MIGEIFATQTTSDNEIVLDVTVRGPRMIGQICLDWILKQRILENVLMFLDIDMHEICIKAKCDVSSKLEKTHFVNRNFLMISIHTNGF